MKPLKFNTESYKILNLRNFLSVIILFLTINLVTPCGSHQLKSNESRPASHSSSTTAINSSTRPPAQYYANHRMNPNDTSYFPSPIKKNNTAPHQQVDRTALDSILRPQIALQIYTDSPHASESNNNKDAPRSSESTANRNSDTMLILPISSHHQDHEENSNSRSSHSKDSMNKLNNWHYITDQSTLSDGSDESRDVSSSGNRGNHRTPTIKAIITMPGSQSSSSEDDSRQRKLGESGGFLSSQQQDDLLLGSSATPNEQHNISSILTDPTNGDVQITMSLNGEELVIDPIGKTGVVTASRAEQLLAENSSNDKRSRQNRESDDVISRALRRHITSELAGDEQSASELDSIDNNNEDGEDLGRDEEPRRLKANEVEDENEDRASSENRNWDDSTSTYANRDEQAADESKNQDGYSTSRYSNDDDRRKGGNRHSSSKSAGRSDRGKSGQTGHRKAASSKRRSTFKIEDREQRSSDEGNTEKRSSDTPSVMIKSEDVKRFEKLLENLRSLSLNVEKAQSKLINKSLPSRQSTQEKHQKRKEQDSDDNEDGQYRDDSDSSSSSKSSWNGQDFKSSNQPKVHSSSNTKSTHSEASTTSDCDRQKSQQRSRKSSSSDDSTSVESDSSPNIVDQDPMTSNDGGDDMNDEGSQNVEQEEQGSDNHNKLSLPYAKALATSDERNPTIEPTKVINEEQPRSMFVRKTVLQNYYDNDAKERAGELERVHRQQHEEQHRRHLESQPDLGSVTDTRRQQQQQQQQQVVGNEEQNRSEDGQSESYIDYNKLDDREVYRGRGDQRMNSGQVPLTRNQVDRMRTLQNLIERAAIEGNQEKSMMTSRR